MWSLFASKLPFSWEAGCRVLTWLVNTPWWPPPPSSTVSKHYWFALGGGGFWGSRD